MRRLIYTPTGRAGEYSDKGHAANIFKGCDHGCRYCYAAGMMSKFKGQPREKYHEAMDVVDDLFARLANDCRDHLAEYIFLCFLCDAYPANADLHGITRECIKIIVESGNRVNILTKGGTRAVKDFDLLVRDRKNKLGATLTFVNDADSRAWEPQAALPDDRLQMLSAAKDAGISTWASIEPVIYPDASLAIMELAIPYVDEFKIGKWNHDPRANAIDWKDFAQRAVVLMKKHGKKFVLKQDLLEAAKSDGIEGL